MASMEQRAESARIAQRCVDKILADMTDRRGLRQEWDNIDEDIQEDIKMEWLHIIATEIDNANS